MQSNALTIEEYISHLPEERKIAITKLRKVILKNLPKGFNEEMSYGMIGYVVPHSIYPAGYHCNPKLPLPFMNICSQKNFIAIYHMGIYGDKNLFNWFTNEFAKQCSEKLDMGKSCTRFKNPETIPYKLIGELSTKLSVTDWINMYEKNIKRKPA